jgi:hypothetical protein
MHSRTIAKKDYAYEAVVGREVPLSFGANFNDDPICRTNLRKSHMLGHTQAERDLVEARQDASTDPNQTKRTMVSSSQAYGSGVSGRHLASRDEFAATMSEPTLRDSASNDVVLRFLGYFVEAIPESPDERIRVRKVALLYHCVDGSILLREAVQVNSGMSQGVILKRQQVPNVTLDDLDLGASINVYGKTVTLVEASEATHRYFQDVVLRPLSPSAPWPAEDTYNATAQSKLEMRPRRTLPTSDFDHKRAMEAMRGSGIISKHAPDDVRTAQQFLRNRINEHLQFAAYWDDRAKKSGDLRLVVIRYYVENDTIEIVEQRPENSGREGAAKLLCRQRIPHPEAAAPTSAQVQQNTFGLLIKANYLNFDDLRVGITLRIAGRDYTIYDADAFTRQWYMDKRGVALAPPVDISSTLYKGAVLPPVQYPPPHDGFGSEEDSLQSCKSLMLKPPRVDFERMTRDAGKILVFRASMTSAKPEDDGREFVVSFHVATEELEINERQLRNSGIVGGKFLAKGRHLKALPDGRKVPFSADDFSVGAIVTIAGRSFQLQAIDERSRRMVLGLSEDVTEARLRTLIIQFRELLNAKYYRGHEAYRAIAPEGSLTAPVLRDFFAKSAANITNEEAAFLINYFTQGDGSGRISFERFLKIMDPGNTTNLDEAANHPRSVKGVEVFSRGSHEYESTIGRPTAVDADVILHRVKKALVAKIVQRRGTVQEAFRMLAGHAPNARLTKDTFTRSLADVLRLNLTAEEREILMSSLYTTAERLRAGVDFKAFCEFTETE